MYRDCRQTEICSVQTYLIFTPKAEAKHFACSWHFVCVPHGYSGCPLGSDHIGLDDQAYIIYFKN